MSCDEYTETTEFEAVIKVITNYVVKFVGPSIFCADNKYTLYLFTKTIILQETMKLIG